MENYIKEDIIGEGAFGTVYKVKCRVTGNVFALKYHVRGVEDSTVRELSCLASLSGHPHIIRMCDCFVDDGTLAMLMPYVPYKLSELIHNEQAEASHFRQDRPPQSLPLSFVAHFSSQVASALSYMHRLSIVHRDLTPFNVLLTEGLTVKVADMGLSRQISKWMSLNVVTVAYRAPELFGVGDFGDYTCSIDMWSLGVMIADAMERRMVFRGRLNLHFHGYMLLLLQSEYDVPYLILIVVEKITWSVSVPEPVSVETAEGLPVSSAADALTLYLSTFLLPQPPA
ncbi:cyclin-dependent kinase 3-like [Hypomesus transpacificus]|uniref:cyclin-dependent kinase 3-like n=1 Tax=Hypomesus transpacificus TaxID=137520 RepID=UPI001F0729D6|nr:cyclin-dependent kinase 3-like [Hypomesus transpacificus]